MEKKGTTLTSLQLIHWQWTAGSQSPGGHLLSKLLITAHTGAPTLLDTATSDLSDATTAASMRGGVFRENSATF